MTLKCHHPFNKATQEMLQPIPEDLSTDTAWQHHVKRHGRWLGPPTSTNTSGPFMLPMDLNCLRTEVGRQMISEWSLSDIVACGPGEPEQTGEHIIIGCPLNNLPSDADLFDLGPEPRAWLYNAELARS